MSKIVDLKVGERAIGQGYQMDEMDKFDFMERIKPMLGAYYSRESDQKLVLKSELNQAMDSPWVHVNQETENRCDIWHNMIFKCLDVLPSECMECYKVVVAPRTLSELFKLLDIQKYHYTEGACKCGTEMREYTHKLYGGYFYNRGLTEGLKNYGIVRELINKHISPDVPVILKRACTEFEMKFGPSNLWEQTIQDGFFIQPYTNKKMEVSDINTRNHWEGMVTTHVDIGSKPPLQNTLAQIHVMQEWIKFAWRHGDPTTKDHNGGDPLYSPSITYHDNEGGNNGR